MIPDEYKELITKLAERTESRAVKWKTTSSSEKFTVALGSHSLTLALWVDYPTESTYIEFEMLDFTGKKIDSFSVWNDIADYEDYTKMNKLYGSARRNALRINESIQDILDVL